MRCAFPVYSDSIGYLPVTTGGAYEFPFTSHRGKAIDNFSLVLGCQTITDMTRVESDKDATISKAVRENFLKDKAVDLTGVNVKTTNGSVDLSGSVPSLEAREHAVKLTGQVAGVQAVVNHLEVKNS